MGITKEDCESIFAGYGTIMQCRVNPPKGNSQKCSAMVRYSSIEEAGWVVANLNGNLAEGLPDPVVVRFANNPGGKDAGGKGGYQGGGCGGGGGGYLQYGAIGGGGGVDNSAASYSSGASFKGNSYAAAAAASGWGSLQQAAAPAAIEGEWTPAPAVDHRSAPYPAVGAGGDYGGGYGGGWGGGKGGGGKGGKSPAPNSFFNLFGAVRKAGLHGGHQLIPVENQVFIKNLPVDTTDLDLFKLFGPFGAVYGTKAMTNPDGSCKGFGFVDFLDPLSAQAAVGALNNFQTQDGGVINVSIKVSKEGKGKGKGE